MNNPTDINDWRTREIKGIVLNELDAVREFLDNILEPSRFHAAAILKLEELEMWALKAIDNDFGYKRPKF